MTMPPYDAAVSSFCSWDGRRTSHFIILFLGVLCCCCLPHGTTALSSSSLSSSSSSIHVVPAPVLSTTEALHRIQAWNVNANQVYESTVTELPNNDTDSNADTSSSITSCSTSTSSSSSNNNNKEHRVAHWAAAIAFPHALQTNNAANVACRNERLLVNGNVVSGGRMLNVGDVLTLTTAGDSRTTLPKNNKEKAATFITTRLNLMRALSSESETHAPLRVLYEDDCMAIVCKPAGIHTMSYYAGGTSASSSLLCLDHLLPLLLTPPSQANDALSAPLPRHRLDARVAGPVVVAKTRSAMVNISNSFEQRLVEKEYRALLVGNVATTSTIVGDDAAFDVTTIDDDHRSSHTHVKVINRTPCAVDGILTDVALFPTTGRRHQLRRHCAHELGAPILGDDLYHPRQQPHHGTTTSTTTCSDTSYSIDEEEKRAAAVPTTKISRVRKRIGLYLYCKRVSVPHPFLTNAATGRRMVIAAEIDEPLRFARHKRKAAKGYKWQQEQQRGGEVT